MSVETLEARVKEITSALEQSLANHNALLGRLAEAQHLLTIAATVVSDATPVVEAVADVAAAL